MVSSGDTLQVPPKDVADIDRPIKSILRSLNMLPSKTALQKANGSATFPGPPDSVAIIEAGATAFSKWWAAGIGAGGLATVITAAKAFWSGQTDAAHIALIASLGAVVVATVLAIALIVSADVKGRATGAAALYSARASVTDEVLKFLGSGTPPTPAGPGKGDVAAAVMNGGDSSGQLAHLIQLIENQQAAPPPPSPAPPPPPPAPPPRRNKTS